MEEDRVRLRLERILASAAFANSGRASNFLRFIVERSLQGRTIEIKESVIAVEVVGRNPSFDSKSDPIVRVEAGRLRDRLDSYYQREGDADRVLISVPKGGYMPEFSERQPPAPSTQIDVLRLSILPPGNTSFDYFAISPDGRKLAFTAALNGNMMLWVRALDSLEPRPLAGGTDYASDRQIVDVGGSHGMLLSAILRRYPGPYAVIFDLPGAMEGAQRTIAGAGLTQRCEAVAGDFFESVPEGADAYLSKQVIHDWDDERAVAILRNIRRAIRPEGRLLLIEFLIPPSNEHSLSKFSDLDMLVATEGRERTAIEYRDLFAAAGFRLTAVHPASQQSVIEGVPVAAN